MHKCLFWLTLVVASQSYAARSLPGQGQLGDLSAVAIPEVKINDKIYRTAPGLRVYGLNNALMLQNHIPQKAAVWFQIEATTGSVWRLWLLSDEEVALVKARPEAPTTD